MPSRSPAPVADTLALSLPPDVEGFELERTLCIEMKNLLQTKFEMLGM